MHRFNVPAEIRQAIADGALVVLNHSGGKDSQAMTALVRQIVPENQLAVVHAHLPGVEWDGVVDHIRANIGDLPLEICEAKKTFFDMVGHRGMWPSAQHRQCTSDLKRGPIQKVIRRLAKERGAKVVINCMGMRAQESGARSRQPATKINKGASCSFRKVIDWLPIHNLLTLEVLGVIADAGQTVHWAYQAGMTRLSCCFCILASKADLTLAASLRPKLYRRYVRTEKAIDHTMRHGQTLEETTGITALQSVARAHLAAVSPEIDLVKMAA